MSLTTPDESQGDNLEAYLMSERFDEDCRAGSVDVFTSYEVNDPEYEEAPWDDDIDSIVRSPHDPPKLESYFYYFGIHGRMKRGPKLIYRNSTDEYVPPLPEHPPREMQVLTLDDHPQLDTNGAWATIREEIVQLLCQRDIQFSSVDIVRFTWAVEPEEDEGNITDDGDDTDDTNDTNQRQHREMSEEDINIDDFDIPVREPEKRYTTPATIWIGILPDTLTGQAAFDCSKEVDNILKQNEVFDIDIAFRETIASRLTGPALYAPVSDISPLKDVIDKLTTALGLPIAGLKSLQKQGTLGAFFRWQGKLYAFTARHVLFPAIEGNKEYNYVTSAPKKKVVVLGSNGFKDLLKSIENGIDILIRSVHILGLTIAKLATQAQEGLADQSVLKDLERSRNEMENIRVKIIELKKFYIRVKRNWPNPRDRVIGHVVWAPPISVKTSPYGYTKDICVIQLDEEKFVDFRGNVLDLGPNIDAGNFDALMNPLDGKRSMFQYPLDRLLKLKDIFRADNMKENQNNGRSEDDEIRCHVIKHGATSNTTIGFFSKYESHVRYYSEMAVQDSTEAAIYNYDGKSGPFSRAGDSGSIIVDAEGRYVALLTGGTGSGKSNDITFGTPFHWLWEIIEEKFPGASLSFDE